MWFLLRMCIRIIVDKNQNKYVWKWMGECKMYDQCISTQASAASLFEEASLAHLVQRSASGHGVSYYPSWSYSVTWECLNCSLLLLHSLKGVWWPVVLPGQQQGLNSCKCYCTLQAPKTTLFFIIIISFSTPQKHLWGGDMHGCSCWCL